MIKVLLLFDLGFTELYGCAATIQSELLQQQANEIARRPSLILEKSVERCSGVPGLIACFKIDAAPEPIGFSTA